MPSTSTTPNLRDFLTVGAAARLLGVCVETLRRWDRADKVKPVRHPVNGYRLYDPEQLLSLLSGLRPASRRDAETPANGGDAVR